MGSQQRAPGLQSAGVRQLLCYESLDETGAVSFRGYLHVQPDRRKVFARATIAAQHSEGNVQ